MNLHVIQREKVMALAQTIADAAARADIESLCIATFPAASGHWYNAATHWGNDCTARTAIDRAVEYLEHRGLLVRDPARPSFVRFVNAREIRA